MIKFTLITSLGTVLLFWVFKIYVTTQEKVRLTILENKCIAMALSHNVPRHKIHRDKGTCYINEIKLKGDAL